MTRNLLSLYVLIAWTTPGTVAAEPDPGAGSRPWPRHTVDDSSRGADGVRLADVNGDGHPDIVTGWEEGGVTRVYLHPGPTKVRDRWPAVTVGKTPAVEDAVFADLDGDGVVDVVSCCEGKTRTVFVHWAPKDPTNYLDPAAWTTEPVPATRGLAMWMFALPMQIDGRGGVDLLVGAKGPGAVVGWLRSPADPRKLADWTFHKLCDAGWVMSLIPADVNGDGLTDVAVSDRKGKKPGVLWLANPGPADATGRWAEYRVGAAGREVMFADVADVDGDGRADVVAAVKPGEVQWFRRPVDVSKPWSLQIIPVTLPVGVGTAKAAAVGDINGDGRPDLVYTCEQADGRKARGRLATALARRGQRVVGQ